MFRFFRSALLAAGAVVAGSAATAATHVVDLSGNLIGATGVEVAGTRYDVDFGNGSCVSLFSGCANPGQNFAFQDLATARLGAEALMAQVFTDTPQGLFDSNPALTAGCDLTSVCFVLIPYAAPASVALSAARNDAVVADFDPLAFSLARETDLATRSYMTYATFTDPNRILSVPISAPFESLSAIPLPAPILLLIGGVGGLAALRRARRA